MKINVNRQEVLRYLGYGGQRAEENVSVMIEQCLEELERVAVPRQVTRSYPLARLSEDQIDLECFRVQSKNLAKNLADCHQVILFAATLGREADVLLRKYSKIQMSKAVMMQAAAAAMIEEYCDMVNLQLKRDYEQQGLYLRPRFSPGYGDFPLECQSYIATALELNKRIGVTLTDSFLMVPSKSVTAIMGVSRILQSCSVKGCEACTKKDCAYRRGRI